MAGILVLPSPLRSYLTEHGFDDDDAEGSAVPYPLAEGYVWDCFEVFKGAGSWPEQQFLAGMRVHPGFEINIDPNDDVMLNSTIWQIVALIVRRAILLWHYAPPCTD